MSEPRRNGLAPIGWQEMPDKDGRSMAMCPGCVRQNLWLIESRLDIDPETGHLERLALDHRRHRAVLDPRRNRLYSGRLQQVHHVLRLGIGGKVDFVYRAARQRITNAAADETHFGAPRGQGVEQPCHF